MSTPRAGRGFSADLFFAGRTGDQCRFLALRLRFPFLLPSPYHSSGPCLRFLFVLSLSLHFVPASSLLKPPLFVCFFFLPRAPFLRCRLRPRAVSPFPGSLFSLPYLLFLPLPGGFPLDVDLYELVQDLSRDRHRSLTMRTADLTVWRVKVLGDAKLPATLRTRKYESSLADCSYLHPGGAFVKASILMIFLPPALS